MHNSQGQVSLGHSIPYLPVHNAPAMYTHLHCMQLQLLTGHIQPSLQVCFGHATPLHIDGQDFATYQDWY